MDTKQLLTDAFDRIVDDFQRALDGLSGDQLAFRPDDGANSIAWLAWHAARVQDHHMSELAERSQVWSVDEHGPRFGLSSGPDDYGFGHGPDQVAAVKPADTAVLMEYLRSVTAASVAYIGEIEDTDFDRVVDRRWDPPVTAGVRIISVINDCIQHAGQARYLRGMIERS